MKVKTVVDGREIVVDSRQVPVMLTLDDQDKQNIGRMRSRDRRYLSYPSSMTREQAREFMLRTGVRALTKGGVRCRD